MGAGQGEAETGRAFVSRGGPLIDLADNVCRGVFGADTLAGPTTTAYAAAGAPFRYLSERESRYL